MQHYDSSSTRTNGNFHLAKGSNDILSSWKSWKLSLSIDGTPKSRQPLKRRSLNCDKSPSSIAGASSSTGMICMSPENMEKRSKFMKENIDERIEKAKVGMCMFKHHAYCLLNCASLKIIM